jgi:alpha-tubulin suppressor-like RCC1 family protein
LTLVTVGRPLLLPGDTVPVTLRARDGAGQPLTAGGATVVFSLQGGSSAGTFLPVVDHHDGSYSADFVGETMGTAVTIASSINGETVTSTPPTLRVVGFTRIIAAGATLVGVQTTTGGFTCGIITTGDMYCWGANRNGWLGNGTTADALVPTAVSGGHAFTQLSGGQDHTCGVRTDGNAYCWGGNDKGELGTRSQSATLTPVRVRLFSP